MTIANTFGQMLDECRNNLGEAPRRFTWKQRLLDLRVSAPSWCHSDELHQWFVRTPELFKCGSVRWGHLVQANVCLYSEGESESGGEVLFASHDENCSPIELSQIARQLYSLKGRPMIAPELSSISSYLTEETVRVFGLPIPSAICGQTQCAVSSAPLPRKFMPNRVLLGSYFPILLSRATPHIVTMLPFQFWPAAFAREWGNSDSI